MPTIPDKIKLPPNKDRRKKLTPADKDNIKALHKQGTPIREIARQYEGKCSRRLIQFVIFPERDQHLKAIRTATKGHLKYYNKEKHTKAIQSLRKYKREIFNLKTYKPGERVSLNENKRINSIIKSQL